MDIFYSSISLRGYDIKDTGSTMVEPGIILKSDDVSSIRSRFAYYSPLNFIEQPSDGLNHGSITFPASKF